MIDIHKNTKNRKFNINNNFFKNPDNWKEEQAYFLGWLLSDGNHTVKKGLFRIRLQECDKKVLEILRNIIKYEGELKYEKRNKINEFIKAHTKTYQNRWGLIITHKEMSNDLLRLGIENNKTNNLDFPNYLKSDLIIPFLRSFYEGDGTISYSIQADRYNNLIFDIHLLGTENFLRVVQKILKNKLNIKSRIVEKPNIKNGVKQLQFNGCLNSIRFFNYFYGDAKYLLRRKFRKFLHLINWIKRRLNDKNRKRMKNYKQFQMELDKAIEIAKDIIKNAEY